MFNNEFAWWGTVSTDDVVINAGRGNLGVQSSYYPLPPFAKALLFLISDRDWSKSDINVLDYSGNLLFCADVCEGNMRVSFEYLKGRTGMIKVDSCCTIRIYPVEGFVKISYAKKDSENYQDGTGQKF